ncbi:MAG: hypothetical protein HOI53_06420 [Francisellaceae bacterium]|jgi:hypothetical protein|nr:hypothetical protein [Francisellaceae bacterium]MBT6207643.1 hypothetical protein [Francisellaceae bacterium]MBT6538432.1 hypothetical protein [Francisellaceae bacterium]
MNKDKNRDHKIKKSHMTAGVFKTLEIDNNSKHYTINTSRRQRKLLPLIIAETLYENLAYNGIHFRTKHFWGMSFHPRNISWWLAINFIIGSFLFSLASFYTMYNLPIDKWLNSNLGYIFFIGSIFFTIAAYLQYLEAINNGFDEKYDKFKFFKFSPKSIAYNISVTQLIGTILFNFNTWNSMQEYDGLLMNNIAIWVPDFVGSIFFLTSGCLAIIEVTHGKCAISFKNLSSWIVIINFLGCVFFQISSSAAVFLPKSINSNSAFTTYISNLTLLIGSVCFLLATYLLLPELEETSNEHVAN